MNNELLDGFHLGDWYVEPSTGTLRGAKGDAHLPSKSIEVLLWLARHPRRLVDRDELITRVWGKGKGSPEALSQAVSALRHALDDRAAAPAFIQTVPTRGYRLLIEPVPASAKGAEVARTELPSTPSDGPAFWQALVRHGVVQACIAYLVGGWLLIQVADATFETIGMPAWSKQFVTFTVIGGFPIVILLAWFLEFAEGRLKHDLGDQPGGLFRGLEQNYLAIVAAYGVAAIGAAVYHASVGFESDEPLIRAADELIPVADNSLAVLRFFNIDGGEETRAFGDGLSEDILDALARLPGMNVSSRSDSWSLPEKVTSETVRRRLRVAYFLEGSVRVDDGNLRVVVQLVDSESGFHVFSRSFDLDRSEFAQLQQEVPKLVVANLMPVLDSQVTELPLISVYSTDADAYVLYRQGIELLYRPRTTELVTESIDRFTNALAIDPDYPSAHAGLCSAYTALFDMHGKPDDVATAEAACAEAQRLGGNLPFVLNTVGRLYVVTGERAKAAATYREVLKINPKDATATEGLAVLAQSDQQFDEAERLMRRAIDLQPGSWNSITTLGNMYFETGRYAEAADEYRKVLYLDANNFVALGNLGSASLLAGDFNGARAAIERSLEIEEFPTFYSNLGIVYYYLGEYEESAAVQRKVVDMSPDSPVSWSSLGDALVAAGRNDEAQEAFQRASELADEHLSVNASDPEALTALAWSNAMTGSMGEALEVSERAVALHPSDPYSHYYRALVLHLDARESAAIDSLEEALRLGYSAKMLAAEPYFDDLQRNQRFAKLLSRYTAVNNRRRR